MPRFFIRIVALLLILCLAADPRTAHAFVPAHRLPNSSNDFRVEEEAFGFADVFGHPQEPDNRVAQQIDREIDHTERSSAAAPNISKSEAPQSNPSVLEAESDQRANNTEIEILHPERLHGLAAPVAVYFDFDDTLFTQYPWKQVTDYVVEQLRPTDPDFARMVAQLMRANRGLPTDTFLNMLSEQVTHTLKADDIRALVIEILQRQDLKPESSLTPGTLKLLAAFEDAGLSVGIATGARANRVADLLDRLTLRPYVGARIHYGDEPKADVLLQEALRNPGRPVIFFGDSLNDVQAARTAEARARALGKTITLISVIVAPTAEERASWRASQDLQPDMLVSDFQNSAGILAALGIPANAIAPDDPGRTMESPLGKILQFHRQPDAMRTEFGKELQNFLNRINPMLQAGLARNVALYPVCCTVACYLAERLLKKYFGDRISITMIKGQFISQTQGTHNWLIVSDQGTPGKRKDLYYYSAVDGQFRRYPNPDPHLVDIPMEDNRPTPAYLAWYADPADPKDYGNLKQLPDGDAKPFMRTELGMRSDRLWTARDSEPWMEELVSDILQQVGNPQSLSPTPADRIRDILSMQERFMGPIYEVEGIPVGFPKTISQESRQFSAFQNKMTETIDEEERIGRNAAKPEFNALKGISLDSPELPKRLDEYVEQPAQSLVRRILQEGGTPIASNAFGSGPLGVVWEHPAHLERLFTPLTIQDYSDYLKEKSKNPSAASLGKQSSTPLQRSITRADFEARIRSLADDTYAALADSLASKSVKPYTARGIATHQFCSLIHAKLMNKLSSLGTAVVHYAQDPDDEHLANTCISLTTPWGTWVIDANYLSRIPELERSHLPAVLILEASELANRHAVENFHVPSYIFENYRQAAGLSAVPAAAPATASKADLRAPVWVPASAQNQDANLADDQTFRNIDAGQSYGYSRHAKEAMQAAITWCSVLLAFNPSTSERVLLHFSGRQSTSVQEIARYLIQGTAAHLDIKADPNLRDFLRSLSQRARQQWHLVQLVKPSARTDSWPIASHAAISLVRMSQDLPFIVTLNSIGVATLHFVKQMPGILPSSQNSLLEVWKDHIRWDIPAQVIDLRLPATPEKSHSVGPKGLPRAA